MFLLSSSSCTQNQADDKDKNCEATSAEADLITSLKEFMESSPVGEFSPRVELLRTFALYLGRGSGDSGSGEEDGSMQGGGDRGDAERQKGGKMSGK